MKFSLIHLVWVLLVPAFLLPRPVHRVVAADDLEPYRYQLSQSSAAFQFWTAPPSERVFKDTPVPSAAGTEIKVYAARNEFEPFQVVVKPAAAGRLAVSIDAFGAGTSAEIYQVRYATLAQPSDSLGRSGPYPDPLWPLENGAVVSLAAGENTAFWFRLHRSSITTVVRIRLQTLTASGASQTWPNDTWLVPDCCKGSSLCSII